MAAYDAIVPDTTTGSEAAITLNKIGSDMEISIRVVSEIAEVENEVEIFVDGTLVYAFSEGAFYQYNEGGASWDATILLDTNQVWGNFEGSSGDFSHSPTLEHTITHMWSSGSVHGFEITDNGDGTVDVADGDVFLRDAATEENPLGNLIEFHIAAAEGIELTDHDTSYIYADYNDGTPQISVTTDITEVNSRSKILLHILSRIGTDIHRMAVGRYSSDFMAKYARKMMVQFGIEYGSGAIASEVGTRKLAITAGSFYFINERKTTSAFDSSGDDTFTLAYRSAVPGVWTRADDQTTVPIDKYDDGDGTLANIGNNKFGVMWVYMCLCDVDPHVVVVYGQAEYANLASAEVAAIPSELPTDVQQYSTGKLIAKIIFQQGQTHFSQIDIPMREHFVASEATIHNGLADLQGGTTDEFYHLTSAEHANAQQLSAYGRIGGAENYTQFSPTSGHQTMVGDARAWRDEISDALTLRQQGSGLSANVTESTVDFTTGSNLDDYLFVNVQLNHDRDETQAIHPHIHWFQAQNNIPNFLLQYRWQKNGGAKTTGWTNYKCNTAAFSYSSGTIHQICYGAGITPPEGSTISDVVQFRILRDNANASTVFTGSDPYTVAVGILAFDCHLVINSLGSDTEYGK